MTGERIKQSWRLAEGPLNLLATVAFCLKAVASVQNHLEPHWTFLFGLAAFGFAVRTRSWLRDAGRQKMAERYRGMRTPRNR
jgi:hypothetical protein